MAFVYFCNSFAWRWPYWQKIVVNFCLKKSFYNKSSCVWVDFLWNNWLIITHWVVTSEDEIILVQLWSGCGNETWYTIKQGIHWPAEELLVAQEGYSVELSTHESSYLIVFPIFVEAQNHDIKVFKPVSLVCVRQKWLVSSPQSLKHWLAWRVFTICKKF